MTRAIPTSLARVVEALELDAPLVVTSREMLDLVKRLQVDTPANVVVQRLARQGWLLPSGVKGVWEFAPGAHGGRIGHGDPFLALRAQRAATPDLDARVALESALWLHGFINRAPSRHIVSVPELTRPPIGLRRAYKTTLFSPVDPAAKVKRLPVCAPATALVHSAHAPTAVGNWGLVLDGLGALVEAADPAGVLAEARDRPNATRARLGYLVEPFDQRLADELDVVDLGTVWFGPRQPVRRRNSRWHVVDTVLPWFPGDSTSP